MLKTVARHSSSIGHKFNKQLQLSYLHSICYYKTTCIFHEFQYIKYTNGNHFYAIDFSTNSYRATSSNNSKDEKNEPEDDCLKESFSISLEEIKIKILDHALCYVNDHGWSKKSISLGSEKAAYAEHAEGLFVNEGADLVLHFVKQSNQKLIQFMQERIKLTEESNEQLNVNIFIRDSLEYRLRLIIPYINVWAEAMKLLLSPGMLHKSTDELSKMVDDMWYMAGDTSTGIEWYAKRGFTAQLFGGLQLVMLTDRSSDYEDTWTFLNQRFKDMQTLKNFMESFQENTENMTNIIKNFSIPKK